MIFTNRALYLFGMSMYIRVTQVDECLLCTSYAMDSTVISYIALTLRAMHLSLTSIRSLSFKKRWIRNVFSKPSNEHTVPLSKKARSLPLPKLYQHRICFVVDSPAGVDSILDG